MTGRSVAESRSTEVEMPVAASGWWIGSIIFVIIWVAIAFWPARVAARKGHGFLVHFSLQPGLLPDRVARRLPRPRSTPLTTFSTTRTTDCRFALHATSVILVHEVEKAWSQGG